MGCGSSWMKTPSMVGSVWSLTPTPNHCEQRDTGNYIGKSLFRKLIIEGTPMFYFQSNEADLGSV